MSARRIHFAAPLVLIACGGAPRRSPPPQAAIDGASERWQILVGSDGCYIDQGSCGDFSDNDHTCNPPPPEPVRCAYGDGGTVVRVDGACWMTEPVEQVPCPEEPEPEPSEGSGEGLPGWLDDGAY